MPHANVVGAGIAGPMAAITLRENGYEVDAWEIRAADDLHSDGILNIKNEVWRILKAHNVRCVDTRQLIAQSEYDDSLDDQWHNITWTDLHLSLVERATELGARFHYASPFIGPTTDLTVRSTGVGTAKEVTTGRYMGVVVARGLAYQFTGKAWQWVRELPNTDVAIGDTRDGASIAAFLHRSNVTLRTTYTPELPPELIDLSKRWRRLFETVPMWQIAPLSDWLVPERMINGTTVRIGDANGQMRPNTASGANLALSEASDVALLVRRSTLSEKGRLFNRREKYELGLTRPL
jgi:2-polyprenyl-6-methoxyphenol hydroxylase-like FAD-dependent oxidoreductase